MLKIDAKLLESLGLGDLPVSTKDLMLSHIYETLEMRVGERLTKMMTSEQLEEFNTLYENKDDAGALNWLTETIPNYKDVVEEEFETLKAEIASDAEQIMEVAADESTGP